MLFVIIGHIFSYSSLNIVAYSMKESSKVHSHYILAFLHDYQADTGSLVIFSFLYYVPRFQ